MEIEITEEDVRRTCDEIYASLCKGEPQIPATGWRYEKDVPAFTYKGSGNHIRQRHRILFERVMAANDPRIEVVYGRARLKRETPYPLEINYSILKLLCAAYYLHRKGIIEVSREKIAAASGYQATTVTSMLGEERRKQRMEKGGIQNTYKLLVDPDRELWVEAGPLGPGKLTTLRAEVSDREARENLLVPASTGQAGEIDRDALIRILTELEAQRALYEDVIARHEAIVVLHRKNLEQTVTFENRIRALLKAK